MTATPDLAAKPPAGTRRQMLGELWFYFRQNRGAVIGLWITIALVLVALAAPLIAPHSPSFQYRDAFLVPPFWQDGGSTRFLLGTDAIGRDILSRLIYGSRYSLFIGAVVVSIALVGGIVIGLVQTVGALYLPGTGSLILVFAVFVLVLLFRPQGLFGATR